ncbi:MAG: CBS domain-containing protein [Pirellulaceae bacterium]
MAEQSYPDPDKFQDPLENYEPRVYADDLERALAEEPVAAIHAQPFIAIAADTPVHAALEKLVGRDIASTLVVDEQQHLVGIFSDRDALDKVALEYDAVKDQPVSEVMTKNPVVVREDDSSAAALCVMAAAGYRHVPVLSADDKIVGIVSPHRVVDFLQKHFQKDD